MTSYTKPTDSAPFELKDDDGDELAIRPADVLPDTALIDVEGNLVHVKKDEVATTALALLESTGVAPHGDGALSRAAGILRRHVSNEELRAKQKARAEEAARAEKEKETAEARALDELADELRVGWSGLSRESLLPWDSMSTATRDRWRGIAKAARDKLLGGTPEETKAAEEEAPGPRFTVEKAADNGETVISDHEEKTGARFFGTTAPGSDRDKRVKEYTKRLNAGEAAGGFMWRPEDYVARPKAESPARRYFVGRTPSGGYAIMDRELKKAAGFGFADFGLRNARSTAEKLNRGERVFIMWNATYSDSRPVP